MSVYPIREKYIDARVKPWFIQGQSVDGLTVDIMDADGNVFTHLPLAMAEELCRIQSGFREELYRLLGYPSVREKI